MHGDREMCLAAGMDDFVSKPFRVDELVRALKQVPAHRESIVLDRRGLRNLLSLVGGDVAELWPLLLGFLDDGPKLVAAIRAGMADGDLVAVRLHAHSLKSNAADFGATALEDLCQTLETAAIDGDITRLAGIDDRIVAEFARLDVELRRVHAAGKLDD
jgi:HPt (histidine-containing phosphotransfer) domain-containing protein